jgi:tetratricopeptide (TPR) repeat protein
LPVNGGDFVRIKNLFAGILIVAATAFPVLSACSRSDDYQKTGSGEENVQVAPHVNGSALIGELKSKLKENPDDPGILWRLADVYFESRQFPEAAENYKKVLAILPDEVEVYNELGLSQHYMGDSAAGLRYVNEGIEKNPYHQRIWLTKGFILAYGMGDLKGAREAWMKSKTLDPESQIGKAADEFLAQFKNEDGVAK